MPGVRILVVAPETRVRPALTGQLRSLGYSSVVVSSGPQAVATAAAERPQIVLADAQPAGDLDGIETASQIRDLFGLPTLFLTEGADEATLRRARAAEPYGLIEEPIDTRALRDILEVASIRWTADKANLLESESRFRMQYEWQPIPTLTWKHVGRDFLFVDFNAAARELTEGGIRPFVGRWASEVYEGRPEILLALQRAFDTRRPQRLELQNYRLKSTGRTIDIEVTFSFVPPDFVLTFVEDVSEQQRSRRELHALSARLLTIQEDERKRLAREVHDELGQALTALKLNVATLQRHFSDEVRSAAHIQVSRVNELIDRTIETARKIARELRPAILDDFGLGAAIRQAVEQFQSDSGLECEVSIRPEDPQLAPEAATVAFRVLQEALTNVARHAAATRVEVRLRQPNGQLLLEVRDNGRGIEEARLRGVGSLGLAGMRERAAQVAGTLEIEGIPGKGTILRLRIPMHGEEGVTS